MTETIELSIDSKLEFVDLVASVTKSVTAKMGFTEDDSSWIELAVHEAVINAITHGNKSADDKKVDVRFETEQNALVIVIRDYGAGFDPSKLPDPTSADNLLNPSGRGIFYMRTFMDEVEYSLHPQGGSVVRTGPLQKRALHDFEGGGEPAKRNQTPRCQGAAACCRDPFQ